MSDMGEMYQAQKEASVIKRQSNRENSAELLTNRGISFVSKNNGAHLIVTHNERTADFWPGTGKYKFRDRSKFRRGVFNLLRDLEQ